MAAQIIRFLAGGGLNTLLAYAIYLLLLQWLGFGFAYSISYLTTLFTSFAINSWFVFRTRWSWKRFSAFPLIHIVNYCLGLLVLSIWIKNLHLDERLAPLVAIAVNLPVNFVLTRLLIHRT